MKTCTKCGAIKPLSEFHKMASVKSGLKPTCKPCTIEQNNKWKAANPERYREGIAAWWRANPDKRKAKDGKREEYFLKYRRKNAERVKIRSKDHYVKNKARKKTVGDIWKSNNKDRVIELKRRWNQENPEKTTAYNHFRRAVRRDIRQHHTSGEIRHLLISQSYLCANPHCNADLNTTKRHLDHKLPFVRGGSNDISNLQWLCAPCNLRKGRSEMSEWLEANYPDRKAA